MSSSPRPLGSPSKESLPAGTSPSRSFTGSTEFNRKVVQTPFDDVVEVEAAWSAKDIGRNAISGVMNDKQPTKPLDNFAPVPPTIIRKVRSTEFDPYIKFLSEMFDKYQYHRAVGLESAMEGTPMLGTSALDDPAYIDLLNTATKLNLLSSDAAVLQTGGVHIKKGRAGLTASQRTRMLSVNAPSLDIVPKVFFETDFSLQAQRTFQLVTKDKLVAGETSSEADKALRSLQEDLSYLLDTVEVHLLKEIARKSSSFFKALSNLQNLHSETLSFVEKIGQLREKVQHIQLTGAGRGIQVLQFKRRRANLAVLHASVRVVRDVTTMKSTIEALLAQSEFMTALNLVESTSLALRGSLDLDFHRNQSHVVSISPINVPETIAPGITIVRSTAIPCTVDLRGVTGLLKLSHQLSEMSRNIGVMMELAFVKNLSDKIIELANMTFNGRNDGPAIHYTSNIINQKFSPGITPPPPIEITDVMLEAEGRLRDRMDHLVFGLLRMDRLGSAFVVYRDSLLLDIKALAKQHHPLIAALDPSIPESAKRKENQLALAKQLKGMTFDAFLDLLLKVYITLLTCLERVALSNALICRIIKRAQDTGLKIGADSPQTLQLPALPASGEILKTITESKSSAHPSKISILRKRLEEEDDEFGSSTDVLSPTSSEVTTKLSYNATTTPMNATVLERPDINPSEQKRYSTYSQMFSDSVAILYSASDLAQVRCAKLLSVRAEQNAQLNPKDFYRLFGATWEFVAGSEALCGRMCLGLKGTMLSQAKAYLNHFHEERTKQITLLIENEQWAQADVPIDFQRITDQIIAAKSFGTPPSERVVRGNQSNLPMLSKQESFDDVSVRASTISLHKDDDEKDFPTVSSSPNKGSKKYVIVNGQKYYMVGCILMFLKQLTQYMECMENMPVLTAEVLNRIMEILKLVNNRLCQVILGAGAMKSAGLKNITARHIALAAQSLGVIVVLIPYMKVGIQQFLPQKQTIFLNDMDRLSKDYRDHQAQLYAKLVSIMMERLAVHSKNLQVLNWDNPDLKDFVEEDGGISTHMITLVKETMTLHKVLYKYLDPETLKRVMGDVFKSYVKKMEEDLKKLDLFTSAGKNRLLIDVQYFIFKLSSLDGCDGPGNYLEVVVNNTKIKDRRQVQPRASEAGISVVNNSPSALPSVPLGAQAPIAYSSPQGLVAELVPCNSLVNESPHAAINLPNATNPSAQTPVATGSGLNTSSWTTKSAYYRNAIGGMFSRTTNVSNPAAMPITRSSNQGQQQNCKSTDLLSPSIPPPLVTSASDSTDQALSDEKSLIDNNVIIRSQSIGSHGALNPKESVDGNSLVSSITVEKKDLPVEDMNL